MNGTASLLFLTVFGYLLSKDPYIPCKIFLCFISSMFNNRLARFVRSHTCRVFSKTLLSSCGVCGVHVLSKNIFFNLIFLILGTLKGFVMLLVNLVTIHFTSTVTSGKTDLLLYLISGTLISTRVFIFISDSIQVSYIFGVVRNPFLPMLTSDIKAYKLRKEKFHWISLPRKMILVYGELVSVTSHPDNDCLLF